ncbi:MAG: ATP-binding protein [Chloroflexi bacterium]|nr:ATP-binding protein [Chloroflexota bacterium]
MESLGDILKRLQLQISSGAADYPADWLAAVEEEAKEPVCPVCRDLGWVRHEVGLDHPDFGRAFPCVCRRERGAADRLERLRRFSNMGSLAKVSLEAITAAGPSAEARARFEAALDAARAYADDPRGCFMLVGGSGTGKTHLAAGMANRLMERGEAVFFTFVPDLLDHLRATYGPDAEVSYDELFEQVKTVPVLVLDDLGRHSTTPWAEEKVYQVLNHRYLNDLPTIVTSSIALDRLDPRLQQRLLDPRTSRVMDLGAAASAGGQRVGAVPQEMLKHMTFETFESAGRADEPEQRETLEAALAMSSAFARDPHGWLVLVGDSGCGKTHLAVAVANTQLERGEEVFFAFVPDLLDHLRYTFSPDSRVTYDELFDRVKQTPLLVLDDLGSETSTAWANEKLYQIVVHRHNARLPTIITTRAIPTGSHDPVASRLNDPRLVVVMPITAPDYRQLGARPQRKRAASAG